jgi:hypothetical protein
LQSFHSCRSGDYAESGNDTDEDCVEVDTVRGVSSVDMADSESASKIVLSSLVVNNPTPDSSTTCKDGRCNRFIVEESDDDLVVVGDVPKVVLRPDISVSRACQSQQLLHPVTETQFRESEFLSQNHSSDALHSADLRGFPSSNPEDLDVRPVDAVALTSSSSTSTVGSSKRGLPTFEQLFHYDGFS